MNRNHQPSDDSWESDAVWKLLGRVPPITASARFADDTARAARLSSVQKAWWLRLLSPAPLAGFAAATAAIVFAVVSLVGPAPTAIQHGGGLSPQAVAIQEVAETETLIAAVDHMDDFSDNELVSLIGF